MLMDLISLNSHKVKTPLRKRLNKVVKLLCRLSRRVQVDHRRKLNIINPAMAAKMTSMAKDTGIWRLWVQVRRVNVEIANESVLDYNNPIKQWRNGIFQIRKLTIRSLKVMGLSSQQEMCNRNQHRSLTMYFISTNRIHCKTNHLHQWVMTKQIC